MSVFIDIDNGHCAHVKTPPEKCQPTRFSRERTEKPYYVSDSESKAGLWTLTQTAAQALAPNGIRVNAIGPGPTLPNSRQDQDEFDKQTRLVPLGHGANPDDIVSAVRYILSAEAMTGQMIALDGGQHLAWETPDVTQVKE